MWHRSSLSLPLSVARFPVLRSSLSLSSLAVVVLGTLLCAARVPGQTPSEAPSQVRAVRLSDVEGGVQILRGDQTEFQQAFANMPVLEGSRLQTGNDGKAEVQFEDGAVARLTPNSSVNFDQLGRNGNGTTASQVEVLSGLVYFEIGADRKQQYSVLFGQNVITPNRASTFRVNLDTNPAEVVVLQGSVQAANRDVYSVKVREGETIRFDAEESRYFLAAGAEPDSWDQWNTDRDKALSSMAARQTQVAGADQNGAGWSDLDYYGDWYSVPQYGNVWAPRGVDAGWDPYGTGYWANYPGYGYVWVSSNPWGWLPYRCGAWNYFGGFGWGWIPNNCGGGGFEWGTDTAIWDAPSYYIRPQRPHPVGPRDNLPHHGSGGGTQNGGWGNGGTIIAVNRGGSGAGGNGPRNGLVNGGSVSTISPRTLQFGGRVLNPLPKRAYAETPGRVSDRVQVSGPRSVVHAPPAGTDMRARPLAPQYGGVAPGDRGGYGSETPGRPPVRSSGDVGAPRTNAPVYVAPAPRAAPPVYSAPPPRSAPPAYSPPPPRSAPPVYSAPRMEQRSSPAPSAPAAPSAPRASSPAPESHSSAPASAPAPASPKSK